MADPSKSVHLRMPAYSVRPASIRPVAATANCSIVYVGVAVAVGTGLTVDVVF